MVSPANYYINKPGVQFFDDCRHCRNAQALCCVPRCWPSSFCRPQPPLRSRQHQPFIYRPTLDTAPTNMIDHQQLAAVLSIQINDRQSLLQPSRLLHAVEHQLSRIGLMGTAIIACQHQSAGENDSVNSIPTSKRPRRHFTQQAYDQNLRTAVETMTVFFHFQQVSVNITYGDDELLRV